MTLQTNDNVLYQIDTALAQASLNGLAEALRILLNEVMKIERAEHLRAQPYEHTGERHGYANGYKPKTVRLRVGEITLDIPQVRDSRFYPSSLEKGLRSERALKATLAERYILGVSTRKIAAITKELCGFEVNSSNVSRATAELDELFTQWRERPLGAYRYLILDARYEHVREGGQVIDAAVLTAVGICAHSGKREVLGCSVALSEQEAH